MFKTLTKTTSLLILITSVLAACNSTANKVDETPNTNPTILPSTPKFAYVFNSVEPFSVSSYSVSSAGILSFVALNDVLGFPFATSYDGTIALGGDGIGGVVSYLLNNGVVSDSESSVTLDNNAYINALALSTDGRHGIAITNTKALYSIGVDESANLIIESQITDLPDLAYDLAISSSGNFVVTGDNSGNVISYSLDSNGNLSKISESTINNNSIQSLVISSDETNVVTFGSSEVSLFGLSKSGGLTLESSITTGLVNSGGAISGDFYYETAFVDKSSGYKVITYKITNNALNYVESLSLSDIPIGIAISQDGNYGYIPVGNNNLVNEFSITSGKLTPLSESSIATGTNPIAISLTY